MERILIINPFGIGDVLFTTPVIKAIKDNLSNISIDYWCNERVRPILENNKNIDKVFALSRGDIKKIYNRSKLEGICKSLDLLLKIKKERFDISLDFSLDHRYSLLSKFAGIKKRIGFNYKNRGRFLTDKIDIDGYTTKHVVEYYLDLLKFLNIEIKNKPNIEVFVSQEDKIWAEQFLKEQGITDKDLLIGIAPAGGASWGSDASYLRWPEEKFASLGNMLIEKYNAKIILFGSADEVGICKRIESSLNKNVVNTAGKITLGQFTALFKMAKIAICNDTGPLHIAVGLGLKTVCICGPVDERVYGPYPYDAKQHIILRRVLECSPCYRNFRLSPCLKNKECLEGIGVDEALGAVNRLLSQ